MAGYARKMGEGRYRLEYMLDGEKYSKNIKAKNDSEAGKILALFVAEIEQGTYQKNVKIRFVEFTQYWLDKYAKPNLSDTTVDNYKSMINKYILDEIGIHYLNKIKKQHIIDFANTLKETHDLSSKTIKNYLSLISSILGYAVELDYLKVNVAENVPAPRNDNKQKKEIEIYNLKEVEKLLLLLDTKATEPLRTMIYTSFFTGMRRGELLGLRWKDIDFKNNTITVKNNKVRKIGEGTKIKETKNKKCRKFQVPKKVINNFKKLSTIKNPTDLIFNMHPDTYTGNYTKFIEEHDIKFIPLKNLRHTNASVLIANGIDLVTVASRLGHLPQTACNYYLQAISENDKKASNVLDKL